jgi:hypothetical protein
MLRATRPRPITHPRWRTIMSKSVSLTPRYLVRTGCNAAEILWCTDDAERVRRLLIEATGRDCLHEPGERCPLLPTELPDLVTLAV